MHIRSTEALQSEKPSFPNARTWNVYFPPGVRLLMGVAGFVLGMRIVVQLTVAPAAGTGA